jgi:Domain of unknown function (DUF6532)
MRSKPYRNERIIQVLRSFFFVGGTSSYAHRYERNFKEFIGSDGVVLREVPIHMVALVATAVRVTYELGHHTNSKTQLYAAIYEWRTGDHQLTDFSADRYTDAYNAHVASLKRIQVERPAAFHTMMTQLYTLARHVTNVLS